MKTKHFASIREAMATVDELTPAELCNLMFAVSETAKRRRNAAQSVAGFSTAGNWDIVNMTAERIRTHIAQSFP